MLDIKSIGATSNAAGWQTPQQTDKAPRPKPPLELPEIEEEKNYTSIFAVICVLIVITAAVGLYVVKTTKASVLKSAEDKKQSLELQLGQSPLRELNKQILSLQNGIKKYEKAVAGAISWSKVFSELEKTDPRNVKFSAFSVDENNLVKLGGEANDFTSLAKLIRSLENSKYFVDIKLVSSTVNVANNIVNFVVSFNVNPEAIKVGEQSQIPTESVAPPTQMPSSAESLP